MRRSLDALVYVASAVLAACGSGTKVPANSSMLPETTVKAPHTASFATLAQMRAAYGLTALDGSLYGSNGIPASSQCPRANGCQTIFSAGTDGGVATVVVFETAGHGGFPSTALTAWRGALYGAGWTGSFRRQSMVYFVDASGYERTLARLPQNDWPSSALTTSNGMLYGTTFKGGSYGRGTVYSVTPNGGLRTIYSFKGGNDTTGPMSVIAHRGTLYGIGAGQQAKCACASIFAVTRSGQEHIVYRFSPGIRHGEVPIAPLTFDASGNIYGAMVPGGTAGGICAEPSRQCGAIFELASAGTPRLRVLHQFTGGNDGMSPNGGLILDDAGHIFGTTAWGGKLDGSSPILGYGTIFQLTPSGSKYTKTTLYAFAGSDGAYPITGLVRVRNAFYGTTSEGGNTAMQCPQGGPQYVAGCGTIYKVVP